MQETKACFASLWLSSYFWILVYLCSCHSSLSGVADLQFLHHLSRSQLGVKRGSMDPIRFSSIKICLQVPWTYALPPSQEVWRPWGACETEKVTRCCGDSFIIIDNSLAPTTRPLMNFRQVLTWAQEESLYSLLVLAFQTGCRESPTQPSRMASNPSGVHWVLWLEKGQHYGLTWRPHIKEGSIESVSTITNTWKFI